MIINNNVLRSKVLTSLVQYILKTETTMYECATWNNKMMNSKNTKTECK